MTRPFPNYPIGRIIFALPFSRSRLEQTVFKSKMENVLVSYYYIGMAKNLVGRRTAAKLMADIAKYAKVVFIDCGVFTIKGQVLDITIAGKLGAVPKAKLHEMGIAAKKKMPEFVEFAKRYASWLAKYDQMYDWAFDLDVDQFLGLPVADKFYAYLCDHVPEPKKIVRIWHSTRTIEDWKRWCESGEHLYLTIEGGGSHSRDPHFYNRYVDIAHKNGVRVHILAATDFKFMQQVPFDTGDSSSWMAGSQYGYVYTPFGRITFAERKNQSAATPNWATLSSEKKEKLVEWLRSLGLPYKQGELQKRWQAREMVNIACFLEEDKPYEATGQFRQVSFLDGV